MADNRMLLKAVVMADETMRELDVRFNEKWSKVEAKMREAGDRTEEHITQQRNVAHHVYMSGVADFAELLDQAVMRDFKEAEKDCPVHGTHAQGGPKENLN
jgi:hypothetical protein